MLQFNSEFHPQNKYNISASLIQTKKINFHPMKLFFFIFFIYTFLTYYALADIYILSIVFFNICQLFYHDI